MYWKFASVVFQVSRNFLDSSNRYRLTVLPLIWSCDGAGGLILGEVEGQSMLCAVYAPACPSSKQHTNCCQMSLQFCWAPSAITSVGREKTLSTSLSITRMEAFSDSVLLVAFSSLNFPIDIPPTPSKNWWVTWKGLSSATHMPLTVEWNIYLWDLKTCIHPWH